MFIGLDVAKRCGVAVLKREGEYFTTVYTGTAQEQLDMLLDVLGRNEVRGSTFYVEKLNTFVNADTTRSLLLRAGYLTGTLERMGGKIEFVNAMTVRKWLGAKDKAAVKARFAAWHLTDDEADALACLMYGLQNSTVTGVMSGTQSIF